MLVLVLVVESVLVLSLVLVSLLVDLVLAVLVLVRLDVEEDIVVEHTPHKIGQVERTSAPSSA